MLDWLKDKLSKPAYLGLGFDALTTGYNIIAGQRAFRMQDKYNQALLEREDNAIQRRVKDLKAAGLSPVLAAGSPASASAVKVGSAPVAEKFGDTLMDVARLEQDEKYRKIESDIALQSNSANIAKTQAEIELINAERRNVEARTPWVDRINTIKERLMNQAFDFAENLNPLTLESKKIDNVLKEKEKIEKDYDIIVGANRALAATYEPILNRLRVSISEANLTNLKKDELLKNAEILAKEMSIKIALEDWKSKRFENLATYLTGNYENTVQDPFTSAMWIGFLNSTEYRDFLNDIQYGNSY